jgi:hypothetical protein
MDKSNELKTQLLWKLYKLNAWGKRHVSESNLPKGFPSHLRNLVKDAAEELKRKGFLAVHATHHEAQWYLNWGRKEEIEELIKEFLAK